MSTDNLVAIKRQALSAGHAAMAEALADLKAVKTAAVDVGVTMPPPSAQEMGWYLHQDAQAHLEAAAKASLLSGVLLQLAEAEAKVHGVMRDGIRVIVAWKDLTNEERVAMYALVTADNAEAAALRDASEATKHYTDDGRAEYVVTTHY